MEAKEILLKVKEYFADLTGGIDPTIEAPAAPTATEYELKDGGKVMIDVLEVGGIVMIDGATALPGELELMDATKLTIGDNGVIEAVVMAEEAANPSMDMANQFAAFQTSTSEKFASYEAKFSDYESKLKKATKVIDQLLQLSQLIVDSPSVAADNSARVSNTFIQTPKKDFSILFN